MLNGKRTMQKVCVIGLTIGMLTFMATPVFAKTINLKGIGAVPLIAIIIGIIIVLLQLIPAAILFFSFIGTVSAIVFKGKKAKEEVVAEEEKALLPGYEPAPVRNEFES